MKNTVEQHLHYNIKKRKKGPIRHSSWDQLNHYLVTVNLQCWQCKLCSGYSRLFDFWLQQQKGTSIDTKYIESHMISFGRRNDIFRVWKSVSNSQIHQQHRKTKNSWLVNKTLMRSNQYWKWMTLWDNNWCHMHIHI